MRRHGHRLRVLVLALPLLMLVARHPGALGDEETEAPPPESLTPAALVSRWLAAPAARRAGLEAALRGRGPAALPALAAAAKAATDGAKERVARLAQRIREDWYRQKTPEGMVYVPAGPVELPREKAPWGPAGKRVQVPGFYIDRTEVVVETWRLWLAHLRKEESKAASWALWKPPAKMSAAMPVVRVRWTQAVRFARDWRGGRLPTAREFERALRGSGLSTYPWGGEMRPGHANLRGHGPGAPLPVGRHERGASVFGVQDLVGNVAEWSATTVREGRGQVYPLVLGGGYRDPPSPALTWRGHGRTSARLGPHEARGWLGFRVVRDLPRLP